jgi:hypothetical protein
MKMSPGSLPNQAIFPEKVKTTPTKAIIRPVIISVLPKPGIFTPDKMSYCWQTMEHLTPINGISKFTKLFSA